MSILEKIECLGCGAPVKMSDGGYFLECKYCGNQYGVPESVSKPKLIENPQVVYSFGSYDSYAAKHAYPDTGATVVIQPWRQ
jgi:hypothetical protein